MELWDIYDYDRNRTGRTMERGGASPDGAMHLVVHICIFNQAGEMLIQKRQPFKHGWSGMWDITVGGHAVAGDTSRMAAGRELFEELGLAIDFSDKLPALSLTFNHGFDDYYLIEQEVDLTTLRLQIEEVAAVEWASQEEILRRIDEGSFIPYYPDFIRLLFHMRHKPGARFRPDTSRPEPKPELHSHTKENQA